MSPFLPEILSVWATRLGAEAPARLAVLVAVAAVVYAARGVVLPPRRARALRIGAVALLSGVAVAAAAARASVVDDAYIALRYARSLLEGDGLVFNVGERVEGYTDLLWVLLVALGTALTGVELPLVALVLNLVVVAANVWMVAVNARRLFGPGGFPLAALLLAGHAVFLAHGTTGLETGLVALLVQLALYALTGPAGPRSSAWAGVALVLAVNTRPDAGLFLPIAALTVAERARPGGPRAVFRDLLALAAPGVVLLGVEAWRVTYYGDWLPNTARAKSANGAYWSQGFVYLVEFWLGSASLPWALAGAAWAVRGSAPRPARLYIGLGLALQTFYVARIGGDFMSGRFFVVLLPLLAISAEGACRDLHLRRPAAAAALVGLLVAGLASGSLVRTGSLRWYIADEGSLYPVKRWSPVTIGHVSWRSGSAVGRTLTDRGITPTIAAGTIGMLGYYGRLPLIDTHGLTDRTIASVEGNRRGYVGHERNASEAYLVSRGVTLVQSPRLCGDTKWLALREVVPPTGQNPKKRWCFLRWDPALARRMREGAPEWGLPDPEAWLDAYVVSLPTRKPAEVAEDLVFLDRWYFEPNPDAARRDAIARRATEGVSAN